MDNSDQTQQGPKFRNQSWTRINSVQDLIDFLQGVHNKSYEIHTEYEKDNYRLVTEAKIIDDEVILKLDIAESDPFEHDE